MQKRVLIMLVCLVVAAVAVARANRVERVPTRNAFAAFPYEIDDWRGQAEPPFTQRELEVLGLDDYLTRTYAAAGKTPVGLYIGYWQSQRQGSTIHSPQNCLPGAGWEPVSQTIMTFPDPRHPGGSPAEGNRYVIQKGLDRVLVLYWFQSHGRIVASEYWSRFYLLTDAVKMDRTDGAIVRLTAPINTRLADGEQRAEQSTINFASALLPKLDAFLPN